ncbi:thioredoxin family protein [Zunongwangia sp. SCSIO 43204]|uniref:thioredoxin family protein n=1 Tax=Zunongwangia sp. SCSIO 43204 TaxID=2779359 RepID=UPI001CA91026|nr:thioredoxin family protein [Zunongwangia sp. SCSIO 43204]UAB84207.1 thioredoxin family protein [Zunongwangia sp. SCSIO 43204]
MTKLIPLMVAVLLGCGTVNTSKESNNEASVAEVQQSMLLGKFKKEDLQQQPYASWFESRYEKFEPKAEAMETIKENINDYEIKIFMGTWCGDSKRETPRFFKILDEIGYDQDKLTAIAVDYSKSTPEKYEDEVNLDRVPTIIFYKDGKEVNRFVEFAQESLEEDIAKIVSGKKYKNSYAE